MMKRYIYGLLICFILGITNTTLAGMVSDGSGSGLVATPDFTSAGGVTSSANLTDNALIRGDGGAKAIQDSGILIDDSDNMTGVASISTSAAIPLLLTNGQLVNIALTSQTVGTTTLTIPDFASVVDEFTFKTKSQTLTNKTLTDLSNMIHADVVHVGVRNISGSTINKGDVVYVSGYNAGQDKVEISLADADVSGAMPSIGLVEADILNNANGLVLVSGVLANIDTSSFSVGDVLYVSTTAGALTATKPAINGDLIQAIAKVNRSHASLGVVLVQGAGRTNDIPNNLTMINTGAFRTGTTAADTAILAAYDVDGASYTTFATLTANNDPAFDLNAITTIGSNAIADASDNLGFFSATTSAQLASILSDETGTLLVVFSDSPTFTTLINLPNAGLHILDTNASHDLIVAPGSDITADRTLTLTTGDSDRTITLSGNPTLDDWFDQSVKSGTSPTFDGANITGISAANVSVATGVGSPTIDQVQEYFDNTGSSGYFSGGTLSDGGAGTLDVAAGSGFIRASASDTAPLLSFKWSASSSIAVTNDTTQYVFVDDAGTISLSADEFLEAQDKILIGVVTDEAGAIESVYNLGVRLEESIGQMGRSTRRTQSVTYDLRRGGMVYGETGTRNITLSTGHLWWGRTDYTIAALDTSVTGGFDIYYRDGGGGFTKVAAATQWPNTQYDDGTGTLNTLGVNKWATLWIYTEPDDHTVILYGRVEHNSEAAADAEAEPATKPNRLNAGSLLRSMVTFQNGAATGDFMTVITNAFASVSASDHGNLSGLGDDDHSIYILADGTRALAGAWDMGSQNLTNVDIDSGTLDGITTLQMPSGDIGATGARITKGWFTDLEVTNAIETAGINNTSADLALTTTTSGDINLTPIGTVSLASTSVIQVTRIGDQTTNPLTSCTSNGTTTLAKASAWGFTPNNGDRIMVVSATTSADRGIYRIVSFVQDTSFVVDRAFSGSDADVSIEIWTDSIIFPYTDGSNGNWLISASGQDKPLQIGGDTLITPPSDLGGEDVIFGCRYVSLTGTGNPEFSVNASDSSVAAVVFERGGVEEWQFQDNAGNFIFRDAGSANVVTLEDGAGADRIYIDSSGSVGISNSSPVGALTIGDGTKHDGFVIRDTAEVQTTDATQTTVDNITLLDENTYHVEAYVTGVQSDGTDRASYHIATTVYRTAAGSATLQGSVTSLHTQESNASLDATFTVSTNDVRVSITGIAAETWEWGTTMKYMNMSN